LVPVLAPVVAVPVLALVEPPVPVAAELDAEVLALVEPPVPVAAELDAEVLVAAEVEAAELEAAELDEAELEVVPPLPPRQRPTPPAAIADLSQVPAPQSLLSQQ